MGMSEAERDRLNAECCQRAWERLAELPSPRTAAAMRELLGLSLSHAAMMAGLPEYVLADFERTLLGGFPSHAIARRLP
ncbi:MAG: hypothetical protein KatS3mg120_2760 [Erythrobacter sp.]|nr:MAG: hypothetical protein KatS3mg120_2760 [Erythrobacter sp.]